MCLIAKSTKLEHLWGKWFSLKVLSSRNLWRPQVSEANDILHVFISVIWFSSGIGSSFTERQLASWWDGNSEAIHQPYWLVSGPPLRASLAERSWLLCINANRFPYCPGGFVPVTTWALPSHHNNEKQQLNYHQILGLDKMLSRNHPQWKSYYTNFEKTLNNLHWFLHA